MARLFHAAACALASLLHAAALMVAASVQIKVTSGNLELKVRLGR
jgi:hypothetical protein